MPTHHAFTPTKTNAEIRKTIGYEHRAIHLADSRGARNALDKGLRDASTGVPRSECQCQRGKPQILLMRIARSNITSSLPPPTTLTLTSRANRSTFCPLPWRRKEAPPRTWDASRAQYS